MSHACIKWFDALPSHHRQILGNLCEDEDKLYRMVRMLGYEDDDPDKNLMFYIQQMNKLNSHSHAIVGQNTLTSYYDGIENNITNEYVEKTNIYSMKFYNNVRNLISAAPPHQIGWTMIDKKEQTERLLLNLLINNEYNRQIHKILSINNGNGNKDENHICYLQECVASRIIGQLETNLQMTLCQSTTHTLPNYLLIYILHTFVETQQRLLLKYDYNRVNHRWYECVNGHKYCLFENYITKNQLLSLKIGDFIDYKRFDGKWVIAKVADICDIRPNGGFPNGRINIRSDRNHINNIENEQKISTSNNYNCNYNFTQNPNNNVSVGKLLWANGKNRNDNVKITRTTTSTPGSGNYLNTTTATTTGGNNNIEHSQNNIETTHTLLTLSPVPTVMSSLLSVSTDTRNHASILDVESMTGIDGLITDRDQSIISNYNANITDDETQMNNIKRNRTNAHSSMHGLLSSTRKHGDNSTLSNSGINGNNRNDIAGIAKMNHDFMDNYELQRQITIEYPNFDNINNLNSKSKYSKKGRKNRLNSLSRLKNRHSRRNSKKNSQSSFALSRMTPAVLLRRNTAIKPSSFTESDNNNNKYMQQDDTINEIYNDCDYKQQIDTYFDNADKMTDIKELESKGRELYQLKKSSSKSSINNNDDDSYHAAVAKYFRQIGPKSRLQFTLSNAVSSKYRFYGLARLGAVTQRPIVNFPFKSFEIGTEISIKMEYLPFIREKKPKQQHQQASQSQLQPQPQQQQLHSDSQQSSEMDRHYNHVPKNNSNNRNSSSKNKKINFNSFEALRWFRHILSEDLTPVSSMFEIDINSISNDISGSNDKNSDNKKLCDCQMHAKYCVDFVDIRGFHTRPKTKRTKYFSLGNSHRNSISNGNNTNGPNGINSGNNNRGSGVNSSGNGSNDNNGAGGGRLGRRRGHNDDGSDHNVSNYLIFWHRACIIDPKVVFSILKLRNKINRLISNSQAQKGFEIHRILERWTNNNSSNNINSNNNNNNNRQDNNDDTSNDNNNNNSSNQDVSNDNATEDEAEHNDSSSNLLGPLLSRYMPFYGSGFYRSATMPLIPSIYRSQPQQTTQNDNNQNTKVNENTSATPATQNDEQTEAKSNLNLQNIDTRSLSRSQSATPRQDQKKCDSQSHSHTHTGSADAATLRPKNSSQRRQSHLDDMKDLANLDFSKVAPLGDSDGEEKEKEKEKMNNISNIANVNVIKLERNNTQNTLSQGSTNSRATLTNDNSGNTSQSKMTLSNALSDDSDLSSVSSTPTTQAAKLRAFSAGGHGSRHGSANNSGEFGAHVNANSNGNGNPNSAAYELDRRRSYITRRIIDKIQRKTRIDQLNAKIELLMKQGLNESSPRIRYPLISQTKSRKSIETEIEMFKQASDENGSFTLEMKSENSCNSSKISGVNDDVVNANDRIGCDYQVPILIDVTQYCKHTHQSQTQNKLHRKTTDVKNNGLSDDLTQYINLFYNKEFDSYYLLCWKHCDELRNITKKFTIQIDGQNESEIGMDNIDDMDYNVSQSRNTNNNNSGITNNHHHHNHNNNNTVLNRFQNSLNAYWKKRDAKDISQLWKQKIEYDTSDSEMIRDSDDS